METEEHRQFNENNIAEFRATGGRLSSFGGAPVLLLTTTGSKSGLPRTSPMMYLADDTHPRRVYVFASAAGADTNPDWFNNILARPSGLTVEIGRQTILFDVQAARYPGFRGYQDQTTRVIPVIAMTLQDQPEH